MAEPGERARLPHALTAGDVVMLVRWQFWSWGRSLFEATRIAATVALSALAALGVSDLVRLARTDWRPGGEAVVVVRRQHRVVRVPVTPELDHVVGKYLAERDRMLPADRGPLLATARGRAITQSYLGFHQFGRMTRRLGLKTPLTRLLINFAVRSFERDEDVGAVAAILSQGYRIRRRRIEDVVQSRLNAVVRRQNPLSGLLRYVMMAQLPPDFRARFAVSLPDSSRPRPGYRPCVPHKTKPLPAGHPAFAALLAVRWPDGRAERKALGAKLALEHAAAVEPFVRARSIKGEQARALFGSVMQWEWYRTLARRHADKAERKAGRVARRERRRRRIAAERERCGKARRPTRAERRLIVEIAGHDWPIGNKALLKFRRTMVVRYLPAVAVIVRAGRLPQAAAAQLFKTRAARISEWITQLERTGTFEPARVAARDAKREAFERELEDAADARSAGTTVTDAMQTYLKRTPGCRIGLDTARNIVYRRQSGAGRGA